MVKDHFIQHCRSLRRYIFVAVVDNCGRGRFAIFFVYILDLLSRIIVGLSSSVILFMML